MMHLLKSLKSICKAAFCIADPAVKDKRTASKAQRESEKAQREAEKAQRKAEMDARAQKVEALRTKIQKRRKREMLDSWKSHAQQRIASRLRVHATLLEVQRNSQAARSARMLQEWLKESQRNKMLRDWLKVARQNAHQLPEPQVVAKNLTTVCGPASPSAGAKISAVSDEAPGTPKIGAGFFGKTNISPDSKTCADCAHEVDIDDGWDAAHSISAVVC